MKYTVIDLFSGCGGLTEGFLKTNKFDFLAHVEWEKPMVDTLRANLQKRWNESEESVNNKVVHFDIQLIDELINGKWSNSSVEQYGKTNGKIVQEKGLNGLVNERSVDVIIGGPPCQAYSLAGRAQDPNSMKDDYRNYLFESFVAIVKYYRPHVFVFENVPGMLSAKPGDKYVVERIKDAFFNIGYKIRDIKELKKSIYNASNFGVAQDRKRVILFGVPIDSNIQLEDFYTALDAECRDSIFTVHDVLASLPKFYPLKSAYKDGRRNISHRAETISSNVKYHEARYHNTRDIVAFKQWVSHNMNYNSTKEKLAFYEKISGRKSNHNKYRNLEWDKPSPTIVSHLYKDGLMFIHPDAEQARSITVKEAAILQSFPNDYIFLGSDAYKYKMIGNAVPVLMGEAIAQAVAKVLMEYK